VPVSVIRCALVLTLVAAACGSSEDDPMLPPSAELGTGDLDFESLADGDSIYVIQGPQGGFHVLGSVRVTGVERGDPNDLSSPKNPTTTFEVYRGSERIDAMGASYVQGLERVEPGVFEMVGRFVILDILADDEVAGDSLHITVSVEDVNGVTVTDERTVVATPHPQNP